MEPLIPAGRWRVAVQDGPAAVARLATFPLDVPAERLAACRALLSAEERARADRYHFPGDGAHYTVARAALRQVLAAELGREPAALAFGYGAHGKPELAGPDAASALAFNVSHSGRLALLGWARGAALGVDLEAHRDTHDQDALVRRFFSAAENRTYFDLPPALRRPAFFACWSRKEAVVKALGQGLTFPLKAFDVTLHPAAPARLTRLQGLSGEASGWCLADVAIAPDYGAAVAIQGRTCEVFRES